MKRLLLLVALAVLAGAAPAHALVVGIGDQKPEMFSDPLFAQTKIKDARLVVPWDVARSKIDRAELSVWLRGARRSGVRPLITFGHARTQRRTLPSVAQYLRGVRYVRHRYPWVTQFITWNEANHCSQPVCNKPARAARYFDALKRACPRCTVVAAAVLDQPNMVRWVRAFTRAAKHRPAIWGLHNYLDANRMRTRGTRQLLRATNAKIWFTETGGIVSRKNKSTVKGFPETPSHAALATKWLFDKLVPLSPRIERVYIYHWNSGGPGQTWDSGLITPGGRARPALAVVEQELEKTRSGR